MKKMLALALVLVLLLPALALADSVPWDLERYTDEELGYSIGYPSDWAILDKSAIADVIEDAADGDAVIAGMDGDDLQYIQRQIEAQDMAIFVSEDGLNFNVTCLALQEHRDGDTLIAQTSPETIERLRGVFPGLQVANGGKRFFTGDNDFVSVKVLYNLNDVPTACTILYTCVDETLYTITFVVPHYVNDDSLAMDQMIEAIAASFRAN